MDDRKPAMATTMLLREMAKNPRAQAYIMAKLASQMAKNATLHPQNYLRKYTSSTTGSMLLGNLFNPLDNSERQMDNPVVIPYTPYLKADDESLYNKLVKERNLDD